MASYNWIIDTAKCPACSHKAEIRTQTYIASSYDGDDTGRFHDREYKIGEKMAWWERNHQNFAEWLESRDRNHSPAKVVEACSTNCVECGAELYAIIKVSRQKERGR